ncbi:MAG: alpha-L-fucosidase [Bacteroidota bacterium]
MKNIIQCLSTLLLLITFACNTPTTTQEEAQSNTYEANWESLAQHDKSPDWFADAKLGIYFHWGPYSVPAYKTEWYPRWMYFPKGSAGLKGWGAGVYEHHEATYGNPAEFNYHDFVPMFTAEHFDAKDWAALFKKAGAKFAGPVAQHHDGFAMWDSEVNPWNAKDKGPKQDVLGELFQALKASDMKTIATFHHAKVLQRYAADSTQWGGKDSHFPYHPDYATSSTDPELRLLYGNMPADEFHDYWLDQVTEVVDNYAPDMIWFDSWLDRIPENYRQKMVAHQFNAGAKRDQATLVAYKQEDIPRNIGILDIEQGGMKEMSPDYWLTDVTLSKRSWSYTSDQTYKTADLLLRNMIDVWSKKGIVLLNVSPRADGIIPDEQRSVLAAIGAWLETHDEAVYGTRTHHIFGYGSAAIEDGHFGGQSATIQYSASDIRFTSSKDGKTIYAFVLGRPDAQQALSIKHLSEHSDASVKSVTFVSDGTAVDWEMQTDALQIRTPEAARMNDIANVFKIELEFGS